MNNTLDYHSPVAISNEQVHKIANLAQMLIAAQEDVKQQEEDLKKAKEVLHRVEQELLPAAMQEVGMDEFKLTNGAKVSINTFYDGRITSDAAFDWLREHGHGALVKTELNLKFSQHSDAEIELMNKVAQYFAENEIDYTNKQSVHPMTLKAFIKETSESTEEDVIKPPKELFNIYIGQKAKVTFK